jgi:hypothetical protein
VIGLPDLASSPDQDIPAAPPADFDPAQARKLILAGKAPPPSWRPWIKVLDLSRSDIVNLSPLAGLSALCELYLRQTGVADISPLANLTKLQWLILDDTKITNIASLSGLVNMTWLSIKMTAVSDLTPLARWRKLRFLDVTSSRVTHAEALSHIKGLDIRGIAGGKPGVRSKAAR